jgi:hypothetical protein
LPPGLHYFWLVSNNRIFTSTSYETEVTKAGIKVNRIEIPLRTEDVRLVNIEKRVRHRYFEKGKSVWASFQENTPQILKRMFQADQKYLKINRIIKSEEHFNEVLAYLFDNYETIKEIFDYYAATENYPSIGWFDFSDF